PHAVVRRPLPYPRPGELVYLASVRPDGSRGPFSIQDYIDLRQRRFSATALAAFANWGANATGAATPERVPATRVCSHALDVLGGRAAVGRLFDASDDSVRRRSSSRTRSGCAATAPI